LQLFYQSKIQDGVHQLEEEESRHVLKVLRLGIGDQLSITDGKGQIYNAEITTISKKTCNFSIKSTITVPKRKYFIHLGIAPTKNIDRLEWFVEKATEIGVDEITFLSCEKSERRVINLDRLYKKAVSAIKQSGQAWLPTLNEIKPFNESLEFDGAKFIAHVDCDNQFHLKEAKPNGKYIVLIGPEGDFSAEEISLATGKGFKNVSLGSTTLRTETAGLAACHILNLINS